MIGFWGLKSHKSFTVRGLIVVNIPGVSPNRQFCSPAKSKCQVVMPVSIRGCCSSKGCKIVKWLYFMGCLVRVGVVTLKRNENEAMYYMVILVKSSI